MNKKISILLMSIIVGSVNTIKSESIAQKFQRLEQLQQEIFEGFFDWFDDEKHFYNTHANDITFNVNSDKENNILTVIASGIDIENEQPDASVEMSEEKNLVDVKITPQNGSLHVTAHDNLLSLYYKKQGIPDNQKEQVHHYAAQSFNRAQTIDQHIDPTILPEFSYNKDEKKLSIIFHTIPEKGYQKKVIPITLS